MAMGRKPAVSLTAEQRKEGASRAVRYRRHWAMSQEQLAVELGTHPSVIAVVERAGPFGSTKFVAACLALDPAIPPRDEHARRHREMRDRTQAKIAADAQEGERLRLAGEEDARRYAEKAADDKEYPLE